MVKISSAYCIEPKVGKILGFFVFVIHGLIAQLAEQRTFNPKVVGSMPTQPTRYSCLRCKYGILAQWSEQSPFKREVLGSSPRGSTKLWEYSSMVEHSAFNRAG